MKKLGAIFAVLGVFLMIAIGCGSSDDEGKSTSGAKSTVQVSNALVRQVRIGMTEQEVRDLLGEPKLLMPMSDPREAGWVYASDGGKETAVPFLDGKVRALPWVDGKPQ